MSGWDKVPKEVKNAVQSKKVKHNSTEVSPTELKSWWTDVLPNKKTIEAELNDINNDINNKKTVNKLINEIYKGGDTLPNKTLVPNAYTALKSILQG